MNQQTLTVLQDSIEHWTRLATGTRQEGESVYADDCALCQKFNNRLSLVACQGCPVAERVHDDHCHNTPWYDVDENLMSYLSNSSYLTPQFLSAASIQLAFLKTLLPEYCHSPLPNQNQLTLILL